MELQLPRYVTPKTLKSGRTGFYWACPKVYRIAGCPWVSAALGENLSQRELDHAAEIWNVRFDEWKIECARPARSDRPLEEHFRYGSIGWLLDFYLTSDAFLERVSEPSRPDYRRILKRVCAIVSKKTGKRCADYQVREFVVPNAQAIYEHFTPEPPPRPFRSNRFPRPRASIVLGKLITVERSIWRSGGLYRGLAVCANASGNGAAVYGTATPRRHYGGMAKGKLKEGDEVAVRATIERVWPDGQVTIFIKSASAGGKLTLLDDRDIVEPTTQRDKLV